MGLEAVRVVVDLEFGARGRLETELLDEARVDLFEILGLDLTTMGIDEFKRMSRAIGEAYLLSLGKPIESDDVLLKSWKTISNGEQPPLTPIFNES